MAEPIFRAVRNDDPLVAKAHRRAAETLDKFRNLMRRLPEASYLAKLRFRDPDLSEQQGKDAFFYLWLNAAAFHETEQVFSGAFFEVPAGFEKWHAVGARLAFDPEDIFDWMVIDSGHVYGGFTRVCTGIVYLLKSKSSMTTVWVPCRKSQALHRSRRFVQGSDCWPTATQRGAVSQGEKS